MTRAARRIFALARLAVDAARQIVRGLRVRQRARKAWRDWTDDEAERISWR